MASPTTIGAVASTASSERPRPGGRTVCDRHRGGGTGARRAQPRRPRDLLAGYTAPADWLLARLVGQDDSFLRGGRRSRAHVDPVLDVAAGIGSGEPAAIGPLSAGLTLSGISMGVAGATAPGSGMEHTASHLLEMADDPSAPEALHGAKSVPSRCWRRCLGAVRAAAADGALHELRFPPPRRWRTGCRPRSRSPTAAGRWGEECWCDYSAKLERWPAPETGCFAARALAGIRWPARSAARPGRRGWPSTAAGRGAAATRRARHRRRDGTLGAGELPSDARPIHGRRLAFLTGRWESPTFASCWTRPRRSAPACDRASRLRGLCVRP